MEVPVPLFLALLTIYALNAVIVYLNIVFSLQTEHNGSV